MTEPDDPAVFAYFHDGHVDRDNIAHYRGLMRSRLLVNRCNECGHWIYPHRPSVRNASASRWSLRR
ncbi:zinc ribbon domain-containing protein [Novosphingobium resinovorum]